MPGLIGNSVRKCGQTEAHQGHHWYERHVEQFGEDWDSLGDVEPKLITHYCPGAPRGPFVVPGYVVQVTVQPDGDLDGSDLGVRVKVTRHVAAHEAEAVPDGRRLMETICRDAGLVAAERFRQLVEDDHVKRTGLRPITPEENYKAQRRQAVIRHTTPMGEALAKLDGEYFTHGGRSAREELPAPGERQVWVSGMVPANPGVCRYCGARIVYAYPLWIIDGDLPREVDGSVCQRAFTVGNYHEPEATRG